MAGKAAKKSKETSAKAEKGATAVIDPVGFSTLNQKKTNAIFIPDLAIKRIKVLEGFNPRSKLGDIEQLAESIKVNGLIQPLTVRPDKAKDGDYNNLAGHRRLAALKLLGYETVSVVVRMDLDDDLDAKAVAAAENSGDARTDLSPVDKGRLYLELAEKKGWAIPRIAKETGANARTVRRCRDFVEKATQSGAEKILDAVEDGKMPFMVGHELVTLDATVRDKVMKKIPRDSDGNIDVSLEQLKTIIKAESKEFAGETNADAGETDGASGKKNGKKKSKKAKAANLVAWRSKKEMTAALEEIANLHVSATESDRGTAPYHETRGALGVLLWLRGETDYPVIIPEDPAASQNAAEAKKELKRLQGMIEAFAADYVDPNAVPAEPEAATA